MDLDDAEDFQLTNSELINRFGPATSEREVSQAISARVPDRTGTQAIVVGDIGVS